MVSNLRQKLEKQALQMSEKYNLNLLDCRLLILCGAAIALEDVDEQKQKLREQLNGRTKTLPEV